MLGHLALNIEIRIIKFLINGYVVEFLAAGMVSMEATSSKWLQMTSVIWNGAESVTKR